MDEKLRHTELLIRVGNLAIVVLGSLNRSIIFEDANLALAGADKC